VALCEENLLAGRYVITTSLSEKAASTAKVVVHYTEERARGLVAICVLARR